MTAIAFIIAALAQPVSFNGAPPTVDVHRLHGFNLRDFARIQNAWGERTDFYFEGPEPCAWKLIGKYDGFILYGINCVVIQHEDSIRVQDIPALMMNPRTHNSGYAPHTYWGTGHGTDDEE